MEALSAALCPGVIEGALSWGRRSSGRVTLPNGVPISASGRYGALSITALIALIGGELSSFRETFSAALPKVLSNGSLLGIGGGGIRIAPILPPYLGITSEIRGRNLGSTDSTDWKILGTPGIAGSFVIIRTRPVGIAT
jgi:hypothetical protein